MKKDAVLKFKGRIAQGCRVDVNREGLWEDANFVLIVNDGEGCSIDVRVVE